MDNHKYYYIKLKDTYFEQDNVKILESLPNGHIYSLILIKLYLKACKHGGQLMMTPSIPYDPENLQTLASVINHDVSHVRESIKIGEELDLITILDGREIWLNEIQNLIGESSTEADRIRAYRQKLKGETPAKLTYKNTSEVEKKTKTQTKELTPEAQQAKELAVLLEYLHKKEDPKYTGNVKGWTKDIEKLIRIDGRDAQEVRKVIEWVKKPGCFWFPNIMSGGKLREKYPTLIMQMKRDQPKESSLEDVAKKYNIKEK